nr:MAG TPA: hypothetical protein [Caudoviricetes sp.]
MAKIQPFTDWLNSLKTNLNKVCEETNIEYGKKLEKTLTKNYYRIIDNFYSSYEPSYYERRGLGNGSLYDLLVFELANDSFEVGFEPSKLLGRDGYNGDNGLYKTIFLLGYHGGAYIDGKMLVPWTAPPIEYDGYKTPWSFPKPWEKRIGIKHGWEYAQRSVSPYRMWKSYIDWYNRSQYQKDYDEILNKNVIKYFKF